jgi:hypothetical protein
MNQRKLLSESGQSIVLVVLGFLAFVAVLALVLDGGNAYAAKRQAQNAADAGALAGATYMCQYRNDDDYVITNTTNTANKYAELNGAVKHPVVNVDLNAASVEVTAIVTKTTFFAGVIGFPQVSPSAVAAAACRPGGAGVMPVAWSCRANVEGNLGESDASCVQKTIKDCGGNPYDLNCTYILMDSVKVKGKNNNCNPNDETCYTQNDLQCSPQIKTSIDPAPLNCAPSDDTKVDCDLNNDCIDELMTGGARSWLDLNGNDHDGCDGACELRRWLSGAEFPDPIAVHTWVPEESGVATSIFHAAAAHVVGDVVILPVFDKLCPGLPTVTSPENGDQCNASKPPDITNLITNSTLNFHVISFSSFHVTCVQTGRNKGSVTYEDGYEDHFVAGNNKGLCNGHWTASEAGAIDENDKTIEGYFVREHLPGYGGPGDWVDTGTYTVVLMK